MKKVAIIDLGSNSVRLNIYAIYEDTSYRVIDEAKESVRLSENMGEELVLKPEAILRTVSVLKMFKKLIDTHKVDKTINFATAAVRNAKNGSEFVKLVKDEVGLEIQVISGEMESYFGYSGVINTIDIDDCLIIDTGGGSTEFTYVKGKKIVNSISLPLGAVVLSERFFRGKTISRDAVKKAMNYIEELLKGSHWLEEAKGLPIIGLGGTFRTLARIDRNERKIPFDKVSQYNIEQSRVKDIYRRLSSMTLEERKDFKGVGKDRADIIVGGCCPVAYILEKLDSSFVVVSNTGLRDGIFFDYYFNNEGENHKNVNVLKRSVINTLSNFDINIVHSKKVADLSLSIFDQLIKLHNMGEECRKILYAAAMLHDLGTYVNYDNHHKHSMYLILNSNIHGLEVRQLVMASLIALMHEDDFDKVDWKSYEMVISKKDMDNVLKMGCIVNIAEKLDRNEASSVKLIKCVEKEDLIEMLLLREEKSEFSILKDIVDGKMFKKVFNKDLFIQ